jgi:hypothetical protein
MVAYYAASEPGSPYSQAQAVMAAGWAFKDSGKKYPLGSSSTAHRDGKTLRRDIGNTFDWIARSTGLKAAADTFNKITGQDYQKRSRGNYTPCQNMSAAGAAISLQPGLLPLGLFVGSLGGVCTLGTALYEFGARGSAEDFGTFSEGLGGATNLSMFAGGGGALLSILGSPAFGISLAAAGLIVKSGDRIHQREIKHRNMISQYQCAYAGLVSFSDNYTNTNDKSVGNVANNFISSYFLIQTCSNILKVE